MKEPYKGPINQPCSACSGGDTKMEYHDHDYVDIKHRVLVNPVTLENFVPLAVRSESADFTEITKRLLSPKIIRLIHASMGMCTETGEFTDQLKRHVFYGAELNEGNLLEEIGDKMWYIAVALSALDKELAEAMSKVIEKLRRRFPEKFNNYEALNRDLAKEQEIFCDSDKLGGMH